MLYNIFIFLHIIFCISIIILILMQHGKGVEAGTSFNNASQTFFGSQGSKIFLVKLTTFITILFFINCFVIGILHHKFETKNNINILNNKEKIYLNEDNNTLNFEDIPIDKVSSKNH